MRLRYFALLATLALGYGCNTPSVPIPPPEPSSISFALDTDQGIATFSYAPNENFRGAIVYVYNVTQGSGVIDTASPQDGSVGPTWPFRAADEDEVVVTFEVDDDNRSRICVRLADGQSGAGRECEM